MSVERNGKTYETVEEMFSKVDSDWDKTPLFWKIIYRTEGFIKFHKKDIYWFFQKIFRGYSDVDKWNMDHFLAKKILKYLVIFRRSKRCGYHGEFNSMEEWNAVLDKMIWSMHQTAKGFPLEESAFIQNKGDEYYKRVQEGNELFGKYFNGLWD